MMVRLQRNKNHFFVTVPIEIIKAFKWKERQELIVEMDRSQPYTIKVLQFDKYWQGKLELERAKSDYD